MKVKPKDGSPIKRRGTKERASPKWSDEEHGAAVVATKDPYEKMPAAGRQQKEREASKPKINIPKKHTTARQQHGKQPEKKQPKHTKDTKYLPYEDPAEAGTGGMGAGKESSRHGHSKITEAGIKRLKRTQRENEQVEEDRKKEKPYTILPERGDKPKESKERQGAKGGKIRPLRPQKVTHKYPPKDVPMKEESVNPKKDKPVGLKDNKFDAFYGDREGGKLSGKKDTKEQKEYTSTAESLRRHGKKIQQRAEAQAAKFKKQNPRGTGIKPKVDWADKLPKHSVVREGETEEDPHKPKVTRSEEGGVKDPLGMNKSLNIIKALILKLKVQQMEAGGDNPKKPSQAVSGSDFPKKPKESGSIPRKQTPKPPKSDITDTLQDHKEAQSTQEFLKTPPKAEPKEVSAQRIKEQERVKFPERAQRDYKKDPLTDKEQKERNIKHIRHNIEERYGKKPTDPEKLEAWKRGKKDLKGIESKTEKETDPKTGKVSEKKVPAYNKEMVRRRRQMGHDEDFSGKELKTRKDDGKHLQGTGAKEEFEATGGRGVSSKKTPKGRTAEENRELAETRRQIRQEQIADYDKKEATFAQYLGRSGKARAKYESLDEAGRAKYRKSWNKSQAHKKKNKASIDLLSIRLKGIQINSTLK